MALSPGTRLGPYEIVAAIGAGGMGEVYRAQDTRLGRDVALKILPQHLSGTPEVRQRFEREARTVSSLNHPHICTLYDIGHQDGTDFLVMEYLEGGTLTKRLERGPLPTPELLRTGIELSDALDKAHRKGILHRDLKPSNIMITKSGAKLMDFGLAKAAVDGAAPAQQSLTQSLNPSARSTPVTAQGTIVGTFQYMSPEQMEGKEADARSDIFSLGAVLYEMATGKRAFEGKTTASVIAAILERQPQPISTIQPMSPPALDHTVKICLSKDPDERFQSAHDVKLQLEWIRDAGSQASVPAPVAARRKFHERFWIAATALLAIIAALLAYGFISRAPQPAPVIVAQIPPPAGTVFGSSAVNESTAQISPDGTRVVFLARDAAGQQLLWVRPLDSPEAQPLQGTRDAITPFWSPDSRYIGFFADGSLKKIDVAGGAPQVLCAAPWGRGATWALDGTIVFAPDISSPLFRVSEGGGTPAPVTAFDRSRQETSHRWPQFLPDWRHFIFYSNSASGRYDGTYVASLDGAEAKLVLRGDTNAVYADGWLLSVQGGNLMAQRFDMSRLGLVGDPMPLQGSVGVSSVSRRELLTASENGVLGYWSTSAVNAENQILWFDRSGKQVGDIGSPLYLVGSARLSPDGKQLAVEISRVGGRDVWVYDLRRNVHTRLTLNPAANTSPLWSPDGKQIAFASNRSGREQIYVKPANGTGAATLLLKEDDSKDIPSSWSHDGRYLAYTREDAQGKQNGNIWILPLFGARTPFAFLPSQFTKGDPSFSPDGQWLAYTSDETGRNEIYIAPFPQGNRQWRVSTNGGVVPAWRGDGKELFYLAPDQKLMATDVQEKGGLLEMGSPHALFQTSPPPLVPRFYDASADGRKFVVINQVNLASSVPFTLVVNWPTLLKRH